MPEKPSLFDGLRLSELRESASDPAGFTWKRCGPQVVALIDAVEAARSVYKGLTCAQDPMDVDERIERLGKALFGMDE